MTQFATAKAGPILVNINPAFCCGQIARNKIPRYIRFVDAFPMTMTGKVQKFIMRETMMRELGPKNCIGAAC